MAAGCGGPIRSMRAGLGLFRLDKQETGHQGPSGWAPSVRAVPTPVGRFSSAASQTSPWTVSILGILLGAALLTAGPAEGQVPAGGQLDDEVRILAVVDYLTETEIYLALGTDHGIRAGDTVSVYDGGGTDGPFLGTIAIQSATDRRSVAGFVDGPFTVARADILYLGIPRALAESRAAEREAENPGREPGVGAEREAPGQQDTETGPRPPLEAHGRLSLEMDALQTTTRWGDSPDQEAERTFSTPTLRLLARIQNLPGGFRLGTNMRLSHRTSPDDIVDPTTSFRLYQLDLERQFESIPLQLHLGRFHNTFDDFSGYMDGLMVHLGEGGIGGGAAIGFEPDTWNEGLSTDRPKFSGFVDFDARGSIVEYSGVVSLSALRPSNDLPDRTWVGLSQRLAIGSAWFRHRLQMDRPPGRGSWTLTRFQLDGSYSLSNQLTAYGGWRRWRPYALRWGMDPDGPHQDRVNVGLSYWSAGSGITGGLSLDRPEGGDGARTLSSSFFLRQTPLLGLGFSGTASHWSRGEDSFLLLSPEVRRDVGRGEVRGAYRLYLSNRNATEYRTHFADLSFSGRLGGRYSFRIQGSVQWGESFSSNRIRASLWRSF